MTKNKLARNASRLHLLRRLVQQRTHWRYIRAGITAGSSVLAKGTSTATLLIAVPLTAKYLGSERYGIWLTLSSLIALIAHVDLGLSNGLVNAVSTADGNGDEASAVRAVSSVHWLLVGLTSILLLALILLYPVVPTQLFIHTASEAAAREARPSLFILIACFLLSMPLGIAERIQIGYQQGYKGNLWRAVGTLLSFALLIAFIRMHASLPRLVLATSAAPLLTSTANSIHEFGWARRQLLPRIKNFHWPTARGIIITGLLFCLGGLAAMSAVQLPYLVAGQRLGAAAVVKYGVAQRMLSVLPVLTSIITLPLWPAYREALSRGEYYWVVRTLRISALTALSISATGAILFFGSYRNLILRWVNADAVPDASSVLPLVILMIAGSLKWVTWMCLNGCNRLRGPALYPFPILLVALAAATRFTPPTLSGVLWPFALAECSTVFVQALELRVAFSSLSQMSPCGNRVGHCPEPMDQPEIAL